MKLALSAKLTINPKRLLSSRWVHDTAHALVSSVRKAKDSVEARGRTRRRWFSAVSKKWRPGAI